MKGGTDVERYHKGPDETPAFMRLGRASRVFRGFSAAMRHAMVDAAYIRRVIKHDQLFSMHVPLDEDCALRDMARRWTAAIAPDIGVDLMACAKTQMMELLEFSSVDEHTDGMLDIARHDMGVAANGTPIWHNFSLVQIRGSGWLRIHGKRHRIEPGDAYVFDQNLEHSWVQDGEGTSRAASFWMEHSLILRRAASSRGVAASRRKGAAVGHA